MARSKLSPFYDEFETFVIPIKKVEEEIAEPQAPALVDARFLYEHCHTVLGRRIEVRLEPKHVDEIEKALLRFLK
jgi:hypothetical protein